MPVQILNVLDVAKAHKDLGEPRGRTTALDTNRMHTVVLCYKTPRERDEMHCHNQDQAFYLVDGQATLHFPEGGHETLKPGMLATITGGTFYQLENSGSGPMVIIQSRSGSEEATKKIDYITRREVTEHRHYVPEDASTPRR